MGGMGGLMGGTGRGSHTQLNELKKNPSGQIWLGLLRHSHLHVLRLKRWEPGHCCARRH